jgi:hypothetical protein
MIYNNTHSHFNKYGQVFILRVHSLLNFVLHVYTHVIITAFKKRKKNLFIIHTR